MTKNFIWQPIKNIGTGRLDKNENYCSVCHGFRGKNSFSPSAAYLSEARIKVLAEGKVLISPQPLCLYENNIVLRGLGAKCFFR